MKMRRRVGAGMVAAAVPLFVLVAGPVDWGFGVLLVVGLAVGGVAALIDGAE